MWNSRSDSFSFLPNSSPENIFFFPPAIGFIGALSLDGTVLPVEGMIAAIIAAKNLQLKTLYLPFDPTIEIPNLELVYIERIQDVIDVLSGQQLISFEQQEP